MSERSLLIKQLPCIACELEEVDQPNKTEEHHLNFDGKSGQERRGDDYSIPLCQWHHRAVRRNAFTNDAMTYLYGPSLALDSPQFRLAYKTDDHLLELTNGNLARLLPATA